MEMKALKKAMENLGETVEPMINDMHTAYFYYVDGTITDPHFVKKNELTGRIFAEMDEIEDEYTSQYIGVAIAYKAMLLRHHSDVERAAKVAFMESPWADIAQTILDSEEYKEKSLEEQFKEVWGVVVSVIKPPIEDAPEEYKYACTGVTVVFNNHTEYNLLNIPVMNNTVFVDHYSEHEVAGFVGGKEHMIYFMERNKK